MGSELAGGGKIGPYELLFRLGKGGMGEVWAARQSGLGVERIVALKLLPDLAGEQSVIMFEDEARIAAALQHPAIVPTIDIGHDGDRIYIAMGLIRGPSLSTLMQGLAKAGRTLSPAIVGYIGERIASALDYAHARAEVDGKKLDLVHRDVTPHNILLDLEGNVLLADFGIARTSVQEHLTRTGVLRGKNAYLSPEQIRGEALDARTDVFALGVCLHEAATAKRLFHRRAPLQILDAVLKDEAPPIASGFPPELAAIIGRALAKAPADRFQSAADMARALAEVNRDAPNAARDLATIIAELIPADTFAVSAEADVSTRSWGDPHEIMTLSVPEVPAPAVAARSMSARWGPMLSVGIALAFLGVVASTTRERPQPAAPEPRAPVRKAAVVSAVAGPSAPPNLPEPVAPRRARVAPVSRAPSPPPSPSPTGRYVALRAQIQEMRGSHERRGAGERFVAYDRLRKEVIGVAPAELVGRLERMLDDATVSGDEKDITRLSTALDLIERAN